MIPREEAGGGAEKGEVFTSGAEFFVGIGKRGHGVMMKQEKVLLNVFLAGREEFFVKQDRACKIPIFKTGSSESSRGRVWRAIQQAIGDGVP